jgi:hypothetical protein
MQEQMQINDSKKKPKQKNQTTATIRLRVQKSLCKHENPRVSASE